MAEILLDRGKWLSQRDDLYIEIKNTTRSFVQYAHIEKKMVNSDSFKNMTFKDLLMTHKNFDEKCINTMTYSIGAERMCWSRPLSTLTFYSDTVISYQNWYYTNPIHSLLHEIKLDRKIDHTEILIFYGYHLHKFFQTDSILEIINNYLAEIDVANSAGHPAILNYSSYCSQYSRHIAPRRNDNVDDNNCIYCNEYKFPIMQTPTFKCEASKFDSISFSIFQQSANDQLFWTLRDGVLLKEPVELPMIRLVRRNKFGDEIIPLSHIIDRDDWNKTGLTYQNGQMNFGSLENIVFTCRPKKSLQPGFYLFTIIENDLPIKFISSGNIHDHLGPTNFIFKIT